jgi:glyoxylase-like metal-dependent hydrolase (beta-lactamase superfamily II)
MPHSRPPSLPAWLQDLGDGVYVIDTAFHRDHFDASYLLLRDGHAAFIDTGTNTALPRLLGALEVLGVARDAVDWVIPTHVHLDHAGGVGALMRELPRARLLVHPRGARHLIDPSALYAGALAVYGAEEMERAYGQLAPVPAERVQASEDGMTLDFGGSPLRLIDTPGHARHHHCVWDERTRGWFTGDTFGISYREFDTARGAWVIPTSTPVQFEPEVLRQSVQRLLASDPACMYLTHFGRVTDVQRLGALQLGLIDQVVRIGLAHRDAPDREQRFERELLAMYLDSLAEHGCTLSADEVARLLAVDLKLNSQGMVAWLDRDSRR